MAVENNEDLDSMPPHYKLGEGIGLAEDADKNAHDSKEEKEYKGLHAEEKKSEVEDSSVRYMDTLASQITEFHLLPFLEARDLAALARTSRSQLDSVIAVEQKRVSKQPHPLPRSIKPPSNTHNRDHYRAKWGKFPEICSGQGMVAPETHHTVASSWNYPILSSSGSHFFKVQGICGDTGFDDPFKQICGRICFATIRAPVSVVNCGGILLGCMYGSYLDRQSQVTREKLDAKLHPQLQRNAAAETPQPYRDFQSKHAIEWADGFNPCGSEPGYRGVCSPIQSPGAREEDANYETVITSQNNLNSAVLSAYYCDPAEDSFRVCEPPIKLIFFCPCICTSLLGYICGSAYGAGKDYVSRQEPVAPEREVGPARQSMD